MTKRIPGRKYVTIYRNAHTGQFISRAEYDQLREADRVKQRVRIGGCCACG